MVRAVSFITLALVLHSATAKIVLLDCGNTVVSKTPGDFSNVCVRNDILRDSSTLDGNWNFKNSKIQDVTFDSVTFKGEHDFENALWTRTTFQNCNFEGAGADITFKNGTMTDVKFEGCTFDTTVEMYFQSLQLTDVTFSNCNFKTNTFFQNTESKNIVFDTTTIGGFDKSLSFVDSVADKLLFKKCGISSTLRFEDAGITELELNDGTTLNNFLCAKEDGSKQSTFTDADFDGTMLADMKCSGSTWKGMKMDGVMASNFFLSSTSLSDLRWSGISTNTEPAGSCGVLDVSGATVTSGDTITGLDICNSTFKGAKFLDPIDFSGVPVGDNDLFSFSNAEISQTCIGNISCITLCGKPTAEDKKCTCSSATDSSDCAKAGSNVNDDLNEEASSSTSSDEEKDEGSACFPADSVVRLESGENIRMQDLKHSHRVSIGGGSHSDVFFFGHRSPAALSNFVHITAEKLDSELRLSPGHYIYANGKLVTARSIKVGDILETADGQGAAVTFVRTQLGRGKFAPATVHGNIVVDGIVVSSYTDAIHPRVAHALLTPLRVLHQSGISHLSSRFTLLHTWSAAPMARLFGFSGPEVVERV